MARGDEAPTVVPPIVRDKYFAKNMFKALIEEIPKYKGTNAPTLYDFTTVVEKVVSLTVCLADSKFRLTESNLKGPT
jgi:hypothetical protein